MGTMYDHNLLSYLHKPLTNIYVHRDLNVTNKILTLILLAWRPSEQQFIEAHHPGTLDSTFDTLNFLTSGRLHNGMHY